MLECGAMARLDVCSVARGLCVNSKVLHKEKVCLSNTRQILRGAFVVMVLGVGPCSAFSTNFHIHPEHLCVPQHTEEWSMAVRSSPSLHMGLSPGSR